MTAQDTFRSVRAFRAVKVGELALSGLARDPRPAQVDSAYRTAINVAHGDGALVSLHPEGVPLHPYSAVIGGETSWDGPDSPFREIRSGDRALVSADCIDFGESRPLVLLGGAEVWDSRLRPLGSGGTRQALKMLDAMWDVALDEVVEGRTESAVGWAPERVVEGVAESRVKGLSGGRTEVGMTSPFLGAMAQARRHESAGAGAACDFAADLDGLKGGGGGIGALMRAEAERLIREMAAAWRAGCRAGSGGRLRPIIGRILGFGPGLTPSGDDFLLGVLAAARAFGSDRAQATEADIAGLVADAAAATAKQSQHMLKAALQGHFPVPVIALFGALGQGKTEIDSSDLRKATRQLTALGSTSGQDMLAGILFWLDTCRESVPERARSGVA